jgi:hypothetical protein
MRTLEELEDEDINAREQKQLTARTVVFPDDLRNRLLWNICEQLEHISKHLFMLNQMVHDMPRTSVRKAPAYSDAEIQHSRENPDPLDVAEEG